MVQAITLGLILELWEESYSLVFHPMIPIVVVDDEALVEHPLLLPDPMESCHYYHSDLRIGMYPHELSPFSCRPLDVP